MHLSGRAHFPCVKAQHGSFFLSRKKIIIVKKLMNPKRSTGTTTVAICVTSFQNNTEVTGFEIDSNPQSGMRIQSLNNESAEVDLPFWKTIYNIL